MDTNDKTTLGIIIFLIGIFLLACLMIYDLRADNKKLSDEISSLNKEIDSVKTEVELQDTLIRADIADLNIGVEITEEKLVLLEESIDPKDFRWARIKKVRDAIYQEGKRSLTIEERTAIASAIVDSSEEFDLSPSLLMGLIEQESNWNRMAVSPKGAQGLAQVMPYTAKEVKDWLGMRYYNWKKAKYNVRVGAAYLARMIHRFKGDEDAAIRAYNAGPTFVDNVRAGIWKNYPSETVDYLEKVKKHRDRFLLVGIDW